MKKIIIFLCVIYFAGVVTGGFWSWMYFRSDLRDAKISNIELIGELVKCERQIGK